MLENNRRKVQENLEKKLEEMKASPNNSLNSSARRSSYKNKRSESIMDLLKNSLSFKKPIVSRTLKTSKSLTIEKDGPVP